MIVNELWNYHGGNNQQWELKRSGSGAYAVVARHSGKFMAVSGGTNGATEVLLNGETVISISEDEYGVIIDSTAPAETLIEYALYGGYSQTVTLYSKKDFKLSLNSVTIASNDGPAINIQSNDRAFVELTAGSTNTLSDGNTWSDRLLPDGEEMDLKGTVFSEGGLIISGSGSLDVTANTKHAIASDDHVRLREGTVVLNAYEKDGVRVNDAFVMDGGDLNISTSDGKGIKVEGKEDDETPLGFIAINDGNLEITSHDKAITASWESDEDGDTDTRADDPDPRVTINGGTINITTTGTPTSDRNGANSDDSLAPEGIESKSDILINAGEILIESTDDGINGIGSIEINGGYFAVTSSTNDAIDSNGQMTINGGVIIAHGAGVPEGGLDNDQNTFAVTGGIFVAFGGHNSTPTASATTQNTVALGSISSGLLTVKDNSGNIAIAYEMPESGSVLVTSPDFQTGTTYSIYNGGQIGSYSENFNGLYLDPASHTNGSEKDSFTINSTVTELDGDSGFNPGPGR
ncbi:MAG: carbohydrate-binding domain-containing protein [Candidatus Thiodiazotropha sp.]